MPYMMIRQGDSWFVHKKNPDGSPGKRMSKKPLSKARATEYMQALYANSGEAEFQAPIPEAVRPVEPEAFFQFKALSDGRWTAFYSNNFQDLTGEWFSEKGIDQFVQMIDSKQFDMPYLFFWHIPYPLGQAEWVARVGHITVAVGHYKDFGDKEIFDKFMQYFETTDDPFMVSHGFLFNTKDKVDDTYTRFLTFEISPIPVDKGVPANPLTVFKSVQEFKMLVVSEEKKAKLVDILGAETAERLLSLADKYSNEIRNMNLKYKEGDELGEVAPVAIENAGEDSTETTKDVEEPQTPEQPEAVEEVVEEPKEKAKPKPEDYPEDKDAGKGEDMDEDDMKHDKMHKKEQEEVPVAEVTFDLRGIEGKISSVEAKINSLEQSVAGLSNFIRLQFGDPKPASKADETLISKTDKQLNHLIASNTGTTEEQSKADAMRAMFPMFFVQEDQEE